MIHTIVPQDEGFKKKCIVMNTFFYSLIEDQASHNDSKILRCLKRKKIDDSICYMIIPIHLKSKNHWCLAILGNLNFELNPSTCNLQLKISEFNQERIHSIAGNL